MQRVSRLCGVVGLYGVQGLWLCHYTEAAHAVCSVWGSCVHRGHNSFASATSGLVCVQMRLAQGVVFQECGVKFGVCVRGRATLPPFGRFDDYMTHHFRGCTRELGSPQFCQCTAALLGVVLMLLPSQLGVDFLSTTLGCTGRLHARVMCVHVWLVNTIAVHCCQVYLSSFA